jgi:hypothetical protein
MYTKVCRIGLSLWVGKKPIEPIGLSVMGALNCLELTSDA